MTPPSKPPFQFGLAKLFGVMTVAAVIAWAVQWPLFWLALLGLAMSIVVAPFILFVGFVYLLIVDRRKVKESLTRRSPR